MKIFHVIMGTTDVEAFKLFPDHSKNILLPASMQAHHNEWRWKNNLAFIHRKKKELFSDSGMIGFMKRFRKKSMEWGEDPQSVLNLQLQLDPDIIAHLDIPCEPHILEMAGINKEKAIDQTVSNARWLLENEKKVPSNKRIAFCIQGWDLDDYFRTIDRFRELGLDELNPERFMFAIGSVCMRKPPDLYQICQGVRNAIPEVFDIHCFGIANVPWMKQLDQYGITSCDSATANISAAMFRILDDGAKRRYLDIRKKNKYMNAALFAFNMESIELHFKDYDEMGFDNLCLFQESTYQMEMEFINLCNVKKINEDNQ